MQWHWGNIGSFLAGPSTVVIAIAALIRGPEAVREWAARQRAQADAARAQAEVDREQAQAIRLERCRTLLGWSLGGVATYTVDLVTDPAEVEQAACDLAEGGTSSYVVLRIAEGEGSVNRRNDLSRLVEREHLVCRPPTVAEREALDKGFEALGVQPAFRASPSSAS